MATAGIALSMVAGGVVVAAVGAGVARVVSR
jgi:hypothetical protein